MAFDPFSLFANLAGGAVDTLLNKQSQGKRTADINNVINSYNQDYGLGRNLTFGTGNGQGGLYGPLADTSTGLMNRLNQYLYGNGTDGTTGQFGSVNDLINQIYNPKSVQSNYGGFDPYGQNIPGLQQGQQGLSSLLQSIQGQTGQAGNIFAGGGQTPQSQQSFGNLSNILQGFTPQQQALTGTANNLFNSGGQSSNPLWTSIMNAAAQGITGTSPVLNAAFQGAGNIMNAQGQTGPTNQGINAAMAMLANGGSNQGLNTLSNTGQNVLSQNGLTPTGAQGEQAALGIINNQGATPTTQGLQGLGLNLASQPSLIPQNLVASMARNEAGTAFQNNEEAARRQAISRGGGAGSNVASGLQNQGLAEYSDKGSQAEAQAVQQALTQQQQLQLQQAGMGANMAQAGGQLQNSNFNTGANTLGNLEGIAAQRFGQGGNFISNANSGANANNATGLNGLGNLAGLQSQRELSSLGLLPNIAQTGTNQAGTYGNLGIAGNAQNLQALGMGSDMYQSVLNSMLGGNNSYNNLIGTTGNYALGAGNLANQGSGLSQSILNSILQSSMGAANFGQGQAQNIYGTQGQGVTQQGNLLNFAGGQQTQGMNTTDNLLKTILTWAQGNGNAANSLAVQNANPALNPWAGLLGAATSSGLSGLSGLTSGGGGGGSLSSSDAGYDNGGYGGGGGAF